LNAKANRPNVFIKIPGTLEGLPAIEETIFSDVPVNVTLLFSARQLCPGRRCLRAGAWSVALRRD
jgi:transaldolase